jgi:hypothetical protein
LFQTTCSPVSSSATKRAFLLSRGADFPLGTMYTYQLKPPTALPHSSSIKSASNLPSGEVTRVVSVRCPSLNGENSQFRNRGPMNQRLKPNKSPTITELSLRDWGFHTRVVYPPFIERMNISVMRFNGASTLSVNPCEQTPVTIPHKSLTEKCPTDLPSFTLTLPACAFRLPPSAAHTLPFVRRRDAP